MRTEIQRMTEAQRHRGRDRHRERAHTHRHTHRHTGTQAHRHTHARTQQHTHLPRLDEPHQFGCGIPSTEYATESPSLITNDTVCVPAFSGGFRFVPVWLICCLNVVVPLPATAWEGTVGAAQQLLACLQHTRERAESRLRRALALMVTISVRKYRKHANFGC